MSIYHKVRAVERVFFQLEKEVGSFQKSTGLGCIPNCGKCCYKTDINATALEFLPLAYYLFKKGEAAIWLDRLNNDHSTTLCPVLATLLAPDAKGSCTEYAHRGLICRLFGFSAMLHKNDKPVLVTCRPIKEGIPDAVDKANTHIATKKEYPLISNYYMQLRSIDESLGEELFPIRMAIAKAINAVLGYYAYRRPPRKSA